MSKKNGHRVETLSQVTVPARFFDRFTTGDKSLDEIFGGDELPGIIPGAAILFTGFPGAGKSTLALKLADLLEKNSGCSVLYNTGEQRIEMVKLIADRIGVKGNFAVSTFTDADDLLEYCEKFKVDVLFQDSIQMLTTDALEDEADLKQLKAVGKKIVGWGWDVGVTTIMIGHITKGGDFAGPMRLKHEVDAHAHLSFNRDTGNRVLELTKNRYGPAMLPHEFAMSANGLELRPMTEEEQEETVKTNRALEKKRLLIGKAKELLLRFVKLSGYSMTDNQELAAFVDQEFGGACSGNYWRGILAKAVRELENEGHILKKANIDRREHFYLEF